MRPMPRLVACALVAPWLTLAAQQGPVSVGTRVRVAGPRLALSPLAGDVIAVDSALLTLVVEGQGAPVVLPLASLDRLEMSRGRHAETLTGFFAGAGLGALVGIAQGSDPPGIISISAEDKALVFGLLGGGLGALIDAFVQGAERWEGVPLMRSHVAIVPQRAGLAIKASLVF